MVLATNGTDVGILGECEVNIANDGVTVTATVVISKTSGKNLLGKEQINALNLLTYVNNVVDTCRFDPLAEFPKLFDGLGTMPGVFSISLKPGTEPVRLFAPRPIVAGLREKAKEDVSSKGD